MSAGLTSRSIAGTTVALPRVTFAGLMAAALLVGGLLGVVARSEFDGLTGTAADASVATSNVRMITERAQLSVGRGPLVADPGTAGALPSGPRPVVDHIGLSERLFPVTSAHRVEHGPLP
jgi:hypothetical protein